MPRNPGFWLAILLLLALPAHALTVSGDGRGLLDADGQPVFLNGATPWHILARLDRGESIRYLDARKSMGFNALLISLIVNDDYHTESFDNAYGEPPFERANDFTRPNEAYFAHVDWFLDEARDRGFLILMEPAYIGWGCSIEGFCQAMRAAGPEVMRDFGRWVGERYRDYDNLIWVNGGDADAGAHDAMDVVDAVANGILEVSPDQLHTAHCNRDNSAIDCYDRPWLDLNNTYSDCDLTPAELFNDWSRSPVEPFFYIEGYYEGEHETSGVCLRSQAYWALLGGAFGHFYGNRPMWDFWPGWEQALDSPGSWSMRYFGELLRSRNWSELVPDWDHAVLVDGYGSISDASWAAAARTTDGTTVIVYTPQRRALTLDLDQITGETVNAWWFDPASGTAVFAGEFASSGQRSFTPPWDADWVLVVDDVAMELPAPGAGHGVELRSTSSVKGRYRKRS